MRGQDWVGGGRPIEPVSSEEINDATAGFSGRGRPIGGIVPARSFLTTFSQISACSVRFAGSTESSERPPVFRRWLWQVTR